MTHAEVKEEKIIDYRYYHTIKEVKNGEGPHPIKTLEVVAQSTITRKEATLQGNIADIHFLNDYLNLEKVRRDHFDYNITEEGNIDGIQLPALLFIPFVENAVKHNFDSEHPSYVHLFFKVDDNQLEFLCENSKPAIATGKSRVGGIGLTNIRRRLELLYIGRYLLEVSETANKYVVNLKLNL